MTTQTEKVQRTYQADSLIINTVETNDNQLEVYLCYLDEDSIRQINNVNGIASLLGLEGEPENSFEPFIVPQHRIREIINTFFIYSKQVEHLIEADQAEDA
ncbi:hypothetical protein [Crocosphaera chwakensis]|uniref:Uncharacterized protein n=1 Tax=Crocosphaera chwakensis CCY0110 TaxID=391612 RepID=A3IWJ9_9CHRO|nr:hypothetical protein [Crocosphaera chwakensis]EAZ89183.1 hypothetical protein CY0110_31815 [Crocosphaera chwakensis CCY0110]